MKITTNLPQQEFAIELAALFEKYGIQGANGWDDGSLILHLYDETIQSTDKSLNFWVEFSDG